MKVFILFMLFGNGDGERSIEFIDVFSTPEKAIEKTIIPKYFFHEHEKKKEYICLSNEYMTIEKPYIIGKVIDCDENITYHHFGGFVIEEKEVI